MPENCSVFFDIKTLDMAATTTLKQHLVGHHTAKHSAIPCKFEATTSEEHRGPKSVIRDPVGAVNYFSSSSGSAESSSSGNPQTPNKQPYANRRPDGIKSRLLPPHAPKDNRTFQSPASIDLIAGHTDNSKHGSHLALLDIHQDLLFCSGTSQHSFSGHHLVTPSLASNKPFDFHMNACLKNATSAGSAIGCTQKFPQNQLSDINSLMNTLMQQCVASTAEASKDADLQSGPASGEVKPKFIISKWSKAETLSSVSEWQEYHKQVPNGGRVSNLTMRLNPPGGNYGADPNIPLFRLSHSNGSSDTVPIASAEQETYLFQPLSDKIHLSTLSVQPHCNQAEIDGRWNFQDKILIKDEVVKLANTVDCVQACLDRIQPMSESHRITQTETAGVQTPPRTCAELDPVMVQQCNVRNVSQVDPLVLGKCAAVDHFNEPVTCLATARIDKCSTTGNMQLKSRIGSFTAPNLQSYNHDCGSQMEFSTTLLQDTSTCNLVKQTFFEVATPKTSSCHPSSMKDAATEITPSVSHRDMGTQMTPAGSSRNSSCPISPRKGLSPAWHNIPTKPPVSPSSLHRVKPVEVEDCHKAKPEMQGLPGGDQMLCKEQSFNSNWSSREEEEQNIGKSLRHFDLDDLRQDVLEARASVWEEATKMKLLARFKHEENKIQAWEERKREKAEAKMKKLEMKLQKLRLHKSGKIANKLESAHRRAEQLRTVVEAHKLEALEKARVRANRMRNMGKHRPALCSCFTPSM